MKQQLINQIERKESSSQSLTADNEFIIKDSSNNPTTIINSSGYMFIDESLYELQINITNSPYSDDFIVLNSSDDIVILINESGSVFLKGELYESIGNATGRYDLTYDNNGNLLNGLGFNYTYNNFNELVEVQEDGVVIEEYIYDDEGNRLIKKQYGSVNTTIYTPFKEFMQIINNSGIFNYTYIYDGSVLVSKINPDGSKWFYHPDHLGSTTLITNESGDIVEETFYLPYGLVDSGGSQEVKLYEGKELDDNTELYYYGSRYYNPYIRVFTQPDTIIPDVYDPQQLNIYSFERNNPYGYVDEGGNFGIAVGIGGGQAMFIEGGAVSYSPFAVSWTKKEGFQIGSLSTTSYVRNEKTGEQGFGITELSGNAGLTFFKGGLIGMEGESQPIGIGLSLGHGGQIEGTSKSLSLSYSPGLGIDIHKYAQSNTEVDISYSSDQNTINVNNGEQHSFLDDVINFLGEIILR